ncbi:hypothetical protein YE20_004608 [Salmonella enterica subsp. enterica serovar Ohio]|nr:hypothetical protein [Salmonella enterica subsp. enterica serovar Ohio]
MLIRTSRKIETYTPKTLSLHLGYISTTYIKNPAFTITSHCPHRLRCPQRVSDGCTVKQVTNHPKSRQKRAR